MITVSASILAISFLLYYINSVMSQLKASQMKQQSFQDVGLYQVLLKPLLPPPREVVMG